MLEGEISQINLIERVVELWREQFTGAIRFENDGIIKIIYFKGGDVLSASTNDRADSIDEILMRAGKVSREHVKQALARRKESETLGDAMLNLGYITRKELTWARRVQVVGVIRSIAAWTDGSFTIVADYLPKRDEGTLFPLPQILVELIVTEQDRQKFDRALDGGSAVFEKAGDFQEVFGRLGLNEDAEAIIAQVDGTRSASEVAAASGRDAFNVYKLLQALATLGILTRAAQPQVIPELSLDDDFATAGVSDASDVWDDDAPAFELDEAEPVQQSIKQPTLEIPSMTFDADETAAMSSPIMSPSRSAWDEPEEDDAAGAATEVAKMPAWDEVPLTPPPVTTVAVPLPVPVPPSPVEPPVDPDDGKQWGFDEAQIETAQRATAPTAAPPPIPPAQYRATPMRGQQPKAGRSSRLLIALLVIALLAGAAYGGFVWWQKREAAPVLVAQKPVTPAPAPTDTTATIVEAPSTTTATTTSTTDTASQPMTITATTDTAATSTPNTIAPNTTITTTAPPATATAPAVQPLPVVTPRNNGAARLAELARNHAANPQGNFTVQIQILCDPSNVEKAMRAGGENVWFVPQTLGTRSCYRINWGRFNTRDEAQRAMANVPAALRDPSAAVRAVARQ
ncbi:MAG TPA: DUF4388 domain-containing protein [Thermoanaerobaculia bacterium]|jgi:cytoskeletal protein RodZ